MVRMPKKKTLMIRNIDIRIKFAAGYSEKEISEICGMTLELFRQKWKGVLEQIGYLLKQGFEDDAKILMNEGIFCIKGFNDVVRIA